MGMEGHRIWILGFAVLMNIGSTCCLRLKELRIPDLVLKDSPTHLECKYELDPKESLYSVKWYKDGNEFFRYVPRDNPPAQSFELAGVDLVVDNCTENSVALAPLTLASSGRYRCEVSGEAPLFQTVSDHRDLTVICLPESGPLISGGKTRYHFNELARLNCTSGPSYPGATLSWFINGKPAEDADVRGPVDEADENGLHTTRLGLEFRVKPKHYKNGDMKLKCLATIASIYWRSDEASVEGERPQKLPAMESRDSAAQSAVNSIADRVQAGSNAMSRIDRILLIIPLILALYYTVDLALNYTVDLSAR